MKNNIAVARSSMPPFEEYVEEIRPIWESRWLTNMGEKHCALEEALRRYLGVENLALCVNGHLALENIVDTLGITGEVITTPFTFASTTTAIVRKGLKPVFCDINERDYTIDTDQIESLITEKTSAILPVHVYGNICDDAAIRGIAEKYSLKVIYDAAHAFGERVNGVGAASLGDASMLSFHATKVFHTIEGGAAVLKNKSDLETFNRLKNFGIRDADNIELFGGNAKMNEFCAAMGLCNLRHIDEAIASRKAVSDRYRERLGGVSGIKLNADQPGVERNYAYFPVVFDPVKFGCSRDEVMETLAQGGIGTRKYFYPLTTSIKAFGGACRPEDTPVAKRVSDSVLCLPIYEGLDAETVDRVCDLILTLKK